MKEFNELIKKIGEELGIKVTLLSDNWLTILEKDNKIHYVQGYKFDLNNHGIGNIMDDKGLFFDLLRYKNIPIIEHNVIFKDYSKKEVLNYFNKNNKEIIVKGNIGTCGNEVFKVDNEKDLFKVIDELFLKEFSISLCPYYDIRNEYRVIILNGEVRIIYGKIRPLIVGDGKSTIKELAINFNDYYQSYDFSNSEYVPKLGEEILLNYQFNLSKGAKMFLEIEDELKKKLSELALKVTNELDITFASVDIIYTTDNKLLVMEANSGVMMDNFIRFNKDKGYHMAYNLYKDAIKLMFEIK